MNISRRDLALFLAVAEERSFTRAAARCNLSQSALSSRIRQIEEELKATLFDRTTRSVELTSEGRLFEETARRLYNEFTEVLENFRDCAARRKGWVRIAALPSVCAVWLPSIIATFRARYPGIQLLLNDALSETCLDLVRTGQADLAITSALGREDDLQALVLGTDYFHVVCPVGHPLLLQEEITAQDLARYPFIHVARNSSVRQHVDIALNPITMDARLEVQYMGTMAGLVEAGVGITIVPALALWQFRRPVLGSRRLSIPKLARPLHLLKRRGHSLSAAAKAFYDLVLQERASFEYVAREGGTDGSEAMGVALGANGGTHSQDS
ncbi:MULTISPECIES: LysR family transcriptional regulator [unclassified Chelatococcus]|uniref:LysR family transcriptional regulator n=1 Tax=unclassified Chelatococcus TaxID=2638111 RepID=UPI001BCE1813|nr:MULTISPECIES: LysR family transcriptional regulator [unclassified Chelatococcus]MBS7700682.1 LysR family transcriptional regulator [Chelatococcus sp. YT9]MBX3559113.1 LysR family transcriptional regulator [Chelatococcus sp.]